ncbi:MAG TPA: G1 family glutamic endopeptidase [Solirubrobacteraceae bacterium]|jgi:hypothetical protein
MFGFRRVLSIAAVLCALGVTVLAAGPALATTKPALRAGVPRLASATSSAFAGWVFGKTGSATSTIEYKAPAITCGTAAQGVAPSNFVFSGKSSSPKEQAAGLLIACSSGQKVYIPYLVINGTETNLTKTVKAGDLIKLTVSAKTTKVSATIADLTSGRTFSKTLTGAGSAALQEQDGDGRVFVNGTVTPVIKFAKINFTKGAINSKPLASVSPRQSVNMQTGSTLQISTTALTPSGSTGNAFTTVWHHH